MEDFVMHKMAPLFFGALMIGVTVFMVCLIIQFIREVLN